MMNILNKLAIAIAPLTLLATIPPAHAATEPDGGPEPKDYSKLYEEYTPLKPKKDPKTGFIVAGKNTSELIKGLTEISGIPVAELEESMRPGGLSLAGFLGKDEGLLEVLAADNAWVLKAGLTHQELARHLNVLVSIAKMVSKRREDSEVFVYRGVRFTTSKREWLGYQESPFRDGTKTSRDIVLKNVDNGKILKFSPLVPMMVERYGFYEGHGTSYRIDPRDIVKVLTFLEVKNEPEQDGTGELATAPESKSDSALPDAKEVKAISIKFDHPKLDDVEFDATAEDWEAIRLQLLPAKRDPKPAAWEWIGTVKIVTKDGQPFRVELYTPSSGPGAFAAGETYDERIYYRGGKTAAVVKALAAAYEKRKNEK